MGHLDSYYKAFVEYRKITENKKECARLREAIKSTNTNEDVIEAIKLNCIIDEEWITNIEEGLKYVEKAVAEERQFIRTEGEVVPIEKAKRTSKDSVAHLARHSGLITHLPEKEGDTIVPDKIYMVEKLSDYAVYENRFLYMMLCYLRDFITIRLDRIRDQMTTYRAKMRMNKDIYFDRRHLKVNTSLYDEIRGDEILLEEYNKNEQVRRIEESYSLVLALLNTPLMEAVSKSPMLRPPIIKTNTLKMNPNFKAAVALYEYVSSYKGEGYSLEEYTEVINPFTNEIGEEMSEVVSLGAFFTYQAANKLRPTLKRNFEQEEKRLLEENNKLLREQIVRLKRRLKEKGEGIEEYIIALENDNKVLRKDSEELNKVLNRIDKLNEEIDLLNDNIESLEKKIIQLQKIIISKDDEILRLNNKYVMDLTKLDNYYKDTIKNIQYEHITQIQELNDKYISERNELVSTYEEMKRDLTDAITNLTNEKDQLTKDYESKIVILSNDLSDVNDKMEQMTKQYNKKMLTIEEDINIKVEEQMNIDRKKLDKTIQEYELKIKKLTNEYEEKLKKQTKVFEKERKNMDEILHNKDEEKYFYKALLHMKRIEQGFESGEEDLSSRERFEELENEYRAFNKLFKSQWKKAKRGIRKEILAKITRKSVKADENEDTIE